MENVEFHRMGNTCIELIKRNLKKITAIYLWKKRLCCTAKAIKAKTIHSPSLSELSLNTSQACKVILREFTLVTDLF